MRHRRRRGRPGSLTLLAGRTEAVARRELGGDRVDRGALRRALEAERRRIARELHDCTGQNLSAAVLELERVVALLGDSGPGARPLVTAAIDLCLRSLEEIRTLSYELSPPLLEATGLPQTLRWYASVFSRRSGIGVELRIGRGVGRLPGEVELALFRIVQEALLNVKRHSGSERALVVLARVGGTIRVEVQDRGRQVARVGRAVAFLPGAGICGMCDRVEACGGRLQITSSGRGTRVRAIIPGGGLDHAADPARGRP